MSLNRQVRLARRPTGWVTEGDFEIVDATMPAPGEGWRHMQELSGKVLMNEENFHFARASQLREPTNQR